MGRDQRGEVATRRGTADADAVDAEFRGRRGQPGKDGQFGGGEAAHDGDAVRVGHRQPGELAAALLVQFPGQGLRAEQQEVEGEELDRDVLERLGTAG